MSIEYVVMPWAPGRHFVCSAYSATLSTKSCAGMYSDAQKARTPRHSSCHGCPIGARHAGVSKATEACGSLYSRLLCCRCRRC